MIGHYSAIHKPFRLRFSMRALLFLTVIVSLLVFVVLQIIPRERVFTKRVAVLGPITSGQKAVALDPPSDNEVLNALRKVLPPGRIFPSKRGMRIVKQKIADYDDPVRVYPMIGPAQQHHAHYKCTLYPRSAYGTDERPYVIYLDHNHLHMVGDQEGLQASSEATTKSDGDRP
ncbi:hypothetical protein [Aeoliella sp.]|uniref:hypothetical protein n=1 Tax=Aeoliella sp. TaxID=2795800 RepID=UPI003CCBA207